MSTTTARSTNTRLYERVRERVLSGRLAAGTPIRQDALASEFGVSKIPLREVLVRLESDGLVVSHLNRGFAVRPLSREDAFDIFDLRLRIEPEATVLGARAATLEDHATAAAAFQALDKALHTNSAAVARHNRRFHIALVRPSARAITVETVERLLALSERYVRVHLSGARGRTARARMEHESLFDAWIARREDALRMLVTKHVASTLSDLTDQLLAQKN